MSLLPCTIPTEEEFNQFFLYIAYDSIGERCNALSTQTEPVMQHQTYKKFVQRNKDNEWSRNILAAINVVQTAKNHYKTFLPMLLSRNMIALHKVCIDITSNNAPPHKEVHGLERCYITGTPGCDLDMHCLFVVTSGICVICSFHMHTPRTCKRREWSEWHAFVKGTNGRGVARKVH